MKEQSYKEMVKQSGRISRQALTLLRTLELPNTPSCFHVAYEFCEGSNEKLTSKISSLKGNPSGNLNDIQHIYYELVALPQETDFLNFSQRFHQLAKSTSSSINEGQNQLKNYARYLQKIKPFLSSSSEDEILDVTTLLIKETEAVHNYAKELEKKLDDASKNIIKIQEEHLQFRKNANRDPLTGMLNRAGLNEALKEVEEQKQYFPISALLLDIDHFKKFNDLYGHLVGDSVLKVVSHLIRKNLKGTDIVSRVGGEEFLVLLLNTKPKEANEIAEKLRNLTQNLQIKHRKTGEYLKQTTISIGIAELKYNQSLLEAIDKADKALYKAKNNGRNCVMS